MADQQGLDVGKAVAQQMAASQPVARIEILLQANGGIKANVQVPSRQVLTMMLVTALLDLDHAFREQAKKQAEGQIETPNPAGGILVAG